MREDDVEVRGGKLHVGVWEADDPPTHTVLLVHGVTASHRCWGPIARRLTATPGTRVVAPDLRGRGRSAGLPGPWGMASHADDLHALAQAYGPFDVVCGHSMGGFVSVVYAARYADDLRSLVLLDGGVPLPLPDGVSQEAAMRATLGPAAERLSMTFPDHAAYRDFWRAHPAFAQEWTADVEAYVDYDLVRGDDGWHSAAVFDAVAEDSAELTDGGVVDRAWDDLALVPTFVRAPLGLLANPPGLYPPARLATFAAAHPGFTWTDADGTNHYTLVLSDAGADLVAATIALR